MQSRVIVASPYWAMNGVNIFSANLVRELRSLGITSEILLTEQDSSLVNIREPMMPLPAGIPFERLPVRGQETWGAHWGALIRYLAERTPCIYIPNSDWRHSNVCPLLPDGVRTVGVVHSDDPLHYDHAARLGRYWDSIVTTSAAIRDELIARHPQWAKRVRTIPIGAPVPQALPARGEDPSLLRAVYHGGLVQYQKRVFDLPKIVASARNSGTPLQLSLLGAGQDTEALKHECRAMITAGYVNFLGLVPHDRLLERLSQFDVFLLTSDFEGMPNALVEAMASGCVPVVTDIRSGVRDLVRDSQNGFVVPVGDIDAFAARLEALHGDRNLLARMSAAARESVVAGGFDAGTMARRYRELFQELEKPDPDWTRPRGALRLPPYRVAGTSIFELTDAHWFPGLGVLPTPYWDDLGFNRQFEDAGLTGIPRTVPNLARPYPNVIVSATSGRISGVDVFSANLVQGLRALGREARILMTCPDDVTPDPMPFPPEIPLDTLPVSGGMSWNRRWQRLRQYLESRDPCIYIPNYDWRNSCISPRLSPHVAIVGIVHSDDPVHYEHVARLGPYWNAVVAVSSTIARAVIEMDPRLAPRLVTIPYGVDVPSSLPPRSYDPRLPLRIVYAGRLVQPQKRVLDIPEIFRAVMNRGVPAELTIIGAGVEEAALRTLCSRWSPGQVTFAGTLPNEKVRAAFAAADVFILTSEFEGLPVSLLEAMAQGCIPVVTDIASGIPEIVRPGESGYRIAVGDIAGFADCLASLHSSAELRRKISAGAQQAVRNGFSTSGMVASYLSLFDRVLTEAEAREYQRPKGPILPPPDSPWLRSPSPMQYAQGLWRRGVQVLRRVSMK